MSKIIFPFLYRRYICQNYCNELIFFSKHTPLHPHATSLMPNKRISVPPINHLLKSRACLFFPLTISSICILLKKHQEPELSQYKTNKFIQAIFWLSFIGLLGAVKGTCVALSVTLQKAHSLFFFPMMLRCV